MLFFGEVLSDVLLKFLAKSDARNAQQTLAKFKFN